jgi:acyl-CoA reductase-like NAD-dependent aldehyde dehydrogenase
VLELGGHAPFIVFADADLDRAVDEAIKAKFATSGQDCLGANRFYVERPVYDAFCERFAERPGADVGKGMDDPDIGPLMNERPSPSRRRMSPTRWKGREAAVPAASAMPPGRCSISRRF